MWPLHIRSKDDYVRDIQGHLDRQEREPLNSVLMQAFEDHQEDENFASWCAEVAYGIESPHAISLLARFMERFPLSLHAAQVAWAESLVARDQFDEGSNEARAYLRRVREAGLEECMRSEELVRDACSRAFLLMTAVYTEAGARRYSMRVLETAMMLPLEPFWIQRLRTEHYRLNDELRQANVAALDAKWEGFFQSGAHAADLVDFCQRRRYPTLAQRLGVLAQRFAEQSAYRAGDDELFEMVYVTDKGAKVLA